MMGSILDPSKSTAKLIEYKINPNFVLRLVPADEASDYELPTADISVRAIDTSPLAKPVGDILFDIERQDDIVSEFQDTNQGILEGIDTV
jgi:hypothetical protein